MPRFHTSMTGQPEDSLGGWLQTALSTGDCKCFRLQSGFYQAAAMMEFAKHLADVSTHLVVGVPVGEPIHIADLLAALSSTEDSSSSLTIVAYRNGMMHSKCLHLEFDSGDSQAAVGSANFTLNGLGLNIESFVSLDSRSDTLGLLDDVARSIDVWRSLGSSRGVYQLSSKNDIDDLVKLGIATEKQPLPKRSTSLATPTAARAFLAPIWGPTLVGPTTTDLTNPSTPPVSQASQRTNVVPALETWTKILPRSDAQQPDDGHPTGKLRLTKAGYPIDYQTYFRRQFFGNLPWSFELRDGKPYEVVEVDFVVAIKGEQLGTLRLTIDHAPHRESGQGNIPTVLSWGPVLGGRLRGTKYTDSLLVLERFPNSFALTIR